MNVMHGFYLFLCAAQFIVAIGLIAIVTMQDPKNEGLTGQIGSATTSSFKGKAGRDEQMSIVTRNVAIVFFTISIFVAVGTGRW